MVLGGARMMSADGQENNEHGQGKQCSEATVRGDYGIQIQGTRPAPRGLIESVIGVVLRNYDGHGSFTQVSNVKGSITGTVPDSQGFGTYDVNASPAFINESIHGSVPTDRPHRELRARRLLG
jgi:hypothetical protein